MLQLVPAQFQPQLSLTPEPIEPFLGKDVKLSLRNAPRQFAQCQWFRQSRSGRVENIFTQFGQRQPEKGPGHTGRETLRDGCSLYIARLTQSDAANYTVVIQLDTDQQTGQGQQFVGRNLSESYYLQISSKYQTARSPPFSKKGSCFFNHNVMGKGPSFFLSVAPEAKVSRVENVKFFLLLLFKLLFIEF